ncbi:killer cell lectin-like receptor 2 [Microtus oregoni]|uniref:killer cell lectin-like receptor 2 n=1 Tax=Microtus oregoni TaxID=111838 RepID=UPI001BB118DF|nr:killer cell lectin-like receptor 2 [Microtus oregoni]
MSDEEITYATVRFGKSSELQTRGRKDENQGPRRTVHRECLAPWYLIAISLGILCSFLVAVAVLVAYLSQDSGNNHELQKTLNSLTQQYHTLQSNNSVMKEMLRNKSRELDDYKRQKELDSSNKERNRCCGESKVLDCTQLTGKNVEGHWFCCGIKCYFILDNKHWSGCKQTCQDYSLKLLKIDDDDELKFLQFKVNPNYYWIGLSYDMKKSKWQWIDNGQSNLDLTTVKSLQESTGCAFLSYKGIHPNDCGRNHPCICERRMDKFPHPVCSMEEK